MKNLIVVGSGGYSKVIIDTVIEQKNYNILGFVDDYCKESKKIHKHNFLGRINDIPKISVKDEKKIYLIVAIGANFLREETVKKIESFAINIRWANVIHPSSIISKNINLNHGNVIVGGAIINPSSYIGNHCLINTGSIIEHDNKFSDFSSCGPAVRTGGSVSLGYCSYVGIGSTIRHGIKIGKHSIIGAHSYVNKDIEDYSVFYGSPAKN